MDIEKAIELLEESIPASVVSKRDAGNGMKLDYLEGWYVIDRLNTIFGNTNWSYEIEELKMVFEGEVRGKYSVSYTAQVSLSVPKFSAKTSEKSYFTESRYVDVGYGDGQDKTNPGKAHELAVKEAVTDAIKRCAKSLGKSLGLALYDKSREHVVGEIKAGSTKSAPARVASTSRPSDKQLQLLRRLRKEILERKLMTLADLETAVGVPKLEDLSAKQATDLISRLIEVKGGKTS